MNTVLCVVSVVTDICICSLYFVKHHFENEVENVLTQHLISLFMLVLRWPNLGVE